MAIAFDASSQSHSGATASVSEASFNWSHTPVGTPKGVIVFTFTLAELDILDGDNVTSVTYGGVSMNQDSAWRAESIQTQSSNECDCKLWFLGSSVPSGAQTVVVNRVVNSLEVWAVAVTVTSSQNSAVHTPGIVLLDGVAGPGSIQEQSVTDGSSGTGNSLRVAGMICEVPSFDTVLPDPIGFNTLYPGFFSTYRRGFDFGSITAMVVTETTPSTGASNVGFADGTAYRAAVHAAIKDTSGAAATAIKDMIGRGFIPFLR